MITLRDIDKENWVKSVMLNPNQNEQVSLVTKFVDPAAYSMVWAQRGWVDYSSYLSW